MQNKDEIITSEEHATEELDALFLDNDDERDGVAEVITVQLDQQAKMKEIFDTLYRTTANSASKGQLGYLIKMSEQLTANASSIGGLIKASGSFKKDVATNRLNIKKAAVEEGQGDAALAINSELVKTIKDMLNRPDTNLRNDPSVVAEIPKKDIDDIDKQIDKNLSQSSTGNKVNIKGDCIIIANLEGQLFSYNTETEDIEPLVDEDYTDLYADEVMIDEKKEEYFAMYNDEKIDVYEVET